MEGLVKMTMEGGSLREQKGDGSHTELGGAWEGPLMQVGRLVGQPVASQ